MTECRLADEPGPESDGPDLSAGLESDPARTIRESGSLTSEQIDELDVAEPSASPLPTSIDEELLHWVRIAAEAAEDKLGQQTEAFFVGEIMAITDWFVVTSGRNHRQVRAIVEAVEEALTRTGGPKPTRIEGRDTWTWVLMDYGFFVVHVFTEESRQVLRSRTALVRRPPTRQVGLNTG